MKIDYSYVDNYCFIDVPFRYGGRHLKIAFNPPMDTEGKSTISLKGRIAHFVIGFFELFPFLGHIIALVERCLMGAKKTPKTPVSVISQATSNPTIENSMPANPNVTEPQVNTSPCTLQKKFVCLRDKCKTEKIDNVSFGEKEIPLLQIKVCSQTAYPTTIANNQTKCGYHAMKNAFIALGICENLFSESDFNSEAIYHQLMAIFNRAEPLDPADALEQNLIKTIENFPTENLIPDLRSFIKMYHSCFSIFQIDDDECALQGIIGKSHFGLAQLQNFIEASQKLKDTKPFKHVFITGLFNPGLGRGHWITLILEKDENGNLAWYGMDSWGNQKNVLKQNALILNKLLNKIEENKLFKNWFDNLLRIDLFFTFSNNDRELYMEANNCLPNIKAAITFMKNVGWLKDPKKYEVQINYIKILVNYYNTHGHENNSIIISAREILKSHSLISS